MAFDELAPLVSEQAHGTLKSWTRLHASSISFRKAAVEADAILEVDGESVKSVMGRQWSQERTLMKIKECSGELTHVTSGNGDAHDDGDVGDDNDNDDNVDDDDDDDDNGER